MGEQKAFFRAKEAKKFIFLGLFFVFLFFVFLGFLSKLSPTYAREGEKKNTDSKKEKKIKKVKEKKITKKNQKHKKKKSGKKKRENHKKVYLTFDDGPSENTDAILEILDQYQVKATFFVIGKADKENRKRYREIVKRGHTIALHSYTHNYKEIYKNLDAFKKDFKRISDLIYKETGIRSKYYRFPGGTSNTVSLMDMKVFVNYFNKKGIRYYDWNVQCGDAVKVPPKPEVLYKNVVNPILRYGLQSYIVLIHDSVPMKNSVKALPMIIERLQREKCELLPIDDDTEQIHHKVQKKKEILGGKR